MKGSLYSVFDRGVNSFAPPTYAPNEMMVKRSLGELFLSEGLKPEMERHEYVKYAESFDLYLIGEYDTDNGVLSGRQPTLILRLADLIAVGK